MSDQEKEPGKWLAGSIELATLRRADAEREKAKVAGKWLEFAREVFEWLKSLFKKE